MLRPIIAIAPSIVLDLVVVGVNVDRTGGAERWGADVEAVYGGERRTVKGEGDSPDTAQKRALALALQQALPAPVLAELLVLESRAPAAP
jgi:hypothetical protein